MGIRFAGLRDWEQTIILSALKELSESDLSRQASLITLHVSESALAQEAVALASNALPSATEFRRCQHAAIPFPDRRMHQQRRSQRISVELPVTFLYQGRHISSTCVNISLGGVRLKSSVPVLAGTKLALQFSFNRNQCFMGFTGTVTAVERHPANDGTDLYAVRVEFKDLTAVEGKVLEACVAELAKARGHIENGNFASFSEQNISLFVTNHDVNPGRFVRRRVVITGIGVVSPIGIGKENFVLALKEGRSGIKPVTGFDVQDLPSKLAAEIPNFDPHGYLGTRRIKQMSRCAQMAVAAAQLAVSDAGLNLEKENRERIGGMIGSSVGGLRMAFQQNDALQTGGYKNMNPYSLIAVYPSAVSGQVAIELGLQGRTDTISSGCGSSGTAFGVAAEMIQRGELDMAVVGASEDPLEETVFSAMCAAGAMSTLNDGTPRPFDAERDGPVLGEGAGVVIFEELEHALKRGARIYAEFKGWGSTADAFSLSRTDPKGRQAERAAQMAMHDAGITPDDVDFINAYGIATPSCDWAEAAVINRIFGKRAKLIPVSAIQSMIGYPWGALGAFQMISNCLAISEGVIAPTLNYSNPDPNCDLDVVPNRSRQGSIRTAMSNLFGCGKNVVLITQRFEQ
jgi:3-oxoacyl-[acyl-carrier-protein] synthase II